MRFGPTEGGEPSREAIASENVLAMERAKPSRDHEADEKSGAKSEKELTEHTMLGPYYKLPDLPGDPDHTPRVLNRFGILERHGGAQEDSVRNIDDGKARGHNLDSADTATHRPVDLDAVGALSQRVAEEFPGRPLSAFPSDYAGAYRQCTADPWQARDFVVATWNTAMRVMVFLLAVTQLFGSGNAPLHFTRIPDLCCKALATLFAIAAIHCVDDVIVTDVVDFISSGFRCWREFADLCVGMFRTRSRHPQLMSSELLGRW